MRIAGIRSLSFCNGDGARFVVFTQGCLHHCPGCHNPQTWDMDGGEEVPVSQIAAEYAKHRFVDGITLSGGDPFYQQDECMKLLDLLGDVNVWVYTGFKYKEIKNTPLAKRANVIVDGPYIERLKIEGKMYGSSNQRIIRR